jgi:hypothetical protein
MDELIKLWKYLTDHYYNVKWIFNRLSRTDPEDEKIYRNQIIVYDEKNNRLWDAICHHGSYGYEKGLLEIYGCICDDVVGYLTADDVIGYLKNMEEKNDN